MATDLSNIRTGTIKFYNLMNSGLQIILEANLNNMKTKIVERIATGKDADGSSFNTYSKRKTLDPTDVLQDYDGLAKGREFLVKAEKESRSVAWYQVREAVGLNNTVHNYQFTGQMLNSIETQLEGKSSGNYKLIIAPKDPKNLKKLIDNETRENEEILEQSDEELQQATEDIIADIIDEFENLF